ncbi:MAG: prenyltransferase/squalene oxidase repeat-containing protein [Candidatus Geothermincolia bacterium]
MRWRAGLTIAVLVLVVTCTLVPTLALRVRAEDAGSSAAINRALDYLKARQQSDGGFAEPEAGSSEQLTSWVTCAVASAGIDPASWRKSGRSPLDYLASVQSDKLTDVEKRCIAVCAAGSNPRSFGGRDLVAAIKARMVADGHIGDLVNEHCWGLIALAAAGEPIPDGSRAWLAARQNSDGGFGYAADTGSDPDDTGAALQALIAAGESKDGSPVSRAISYLVFCQGDDGGFTWQSQGSNVGSTAWCVQGLIAAGENVSSSEWTVSGTTPLDFINGMQQGDGHFRHSKGMDSNPAWMTAEAVPAVLRKPFPIKKETTTQPTTDPAPAQTSNQVTTSSTSTSTGESEAAADENLEAGGEQGTAPAADGQQGVAARSGEASAGNRGNTPSGGERGLVSMAADTRSPGGGGSSDRGLPLLLIFCAMYLVLLGLVYLFHKVLTT